MGTDIGEKPQAHTRSKTQKIRALAKGRGAIIGAAVVIFVLLLSGVMNLAETALQSELRFRVDSLQAECRGLDEEIATLSYQMAPITALTAIEVRAKRAGLGPATKVEYLNVPAFVPSSGDETP